MPHLESIELSALYRAARVGGDFFDFLTIKGKLIFVLMDIAGKRETALEVAAAAQHAFRKRSEILFTQGHSDSDAITDLLLEVNRAIIQEAAGVRCAPAFLGCYEEAIGTLTYINAGHTPAFLKDEQGVLLLEANGLPLGLFTHATHDSQFCGLSPNAALVLVSKGLTEVRKGNDELGVKGVQEFLSGAAYDSADALGHALLERVEAFQKEPTRFGPSLNLPGFGKSEPNDITTVVLRRRSARVIVSR